MSSDIYTAEPALPSSAPSASLPAHGHLCLRHLSTWLRLTAAVNSSGLADLSSGGDC